MRLLGMLALGALILALSRTPLRVSTPPATVASRGAPSLSPAEAAAGFRIGAGWDDIQILSQVRTVAAAQSDLAADARVLAVEIAGEACAYPINILNHHEMVQDEVARVPIQVSY